MATAGTANNRRAWAAMALVLLAAAGCREDQAGPANAAIVVGPHGEMTLTALTMGRIPFKMILVPGSLSADEARRRLEAAHRAVEHVNTTMSAYLPGSDLSRLNAADAGQRVALNAKLLALLEASRVHTTATDGAFDPTARPIFELWKSAGKQGRLPAEAEIAAARARLGWQRLTLDRAAGTAVKADAGLQIDLGGIAQGHAADEALKVLTAGDAPAGALVDISGDIALAGRGPAGDPWVVGIVHPFRPEELCGKLALDRAVSTSGNYFRFVEIAGRRYSHIVDPRTGRPADAAASVTVIADDCTTADVWATALSVLGQDGLARAQAAVPNLEAMLIMGDPNDHRIVRTAGFDRYLVKGETIDLD